MRSRRLQRAVAGLDHHALLPLLQAAGIVEIGQARTIVECARSDAQVFGGGKAQRSELSAAPESGFADVSDVFGHGICRAGPGLRVRHQAGAFAGIAPEEEHAVLGIVCRVVGRDLKGFQRRAVVKGSLAQAVDVRGYGDGREPRAAVKRGGLNAQKRIGQCDGTHLGTIVKRVGPDGRHVIGDHHVLSRAGVTAQQAVPVNDEGVASGLLVMDGPHPVGQTRDIRAGADIAVDPDRSVELTHEQLFRNLRVQTQEIQLPEA